MQLAIKRTFSRTSGLTLIEVIFAAAIFATLMVSVTINVHRDSEALRSLARRSSMEIKADVMINEIKRRLEFAQGGTSQAWLQADLDGGETGEALVDTTLGFPDQGMLLLQPGTLSEERVAYQNFGTIPVRFTGLLRGQQCTTSTNHPDGTLVRWADMAVVLEDQINPPVNFYDGVSQELIGQLFYRGDGTGFSFRVPTDPTGSMDFFDDAGNVQWGATVEGVDTLDGWSCLQFRPVATISEAARGVDFNADGDRTDNFDLGRIVIRSWVTNDPDMPTTEIALCPPMVLQEQCAYGSDLDNDGFQDPIFLWDPTSGRLRLRLFLLVSNDQDIPEVRPIERAMFLRNGSQS